MLLNEALEYTQENDVLRITNFWYNCLRRMSPGGYNYTQKSDNPDELTYKYTNSDLDTYIETTIQMN